MKRTLKNTIGTVTIAVVSAVLTILIYTNINTHEAQVIQTEQTVKPTYATLPASPAINTDFTEAAESSVQAVVHVKVKVSYKSNYVDLWDLLRGNEPQERIFEGSGSGVIISKDGYIVTNNHVIEKSNNIEVILNDKRRYDARLIGTDPTTDIALLKVDADNLPAIPFGNSDNLKLGEWVLAVGNPFNLSTTVTAGIVSAKARGIGILGDATHMGIESYIQTDAAVNPGNSGGALVNTSGELVGINSAIASPTGAYAGYSFAVPVSIVKKVVADLMEYGEVQRAFLGVMMRDIDADFAEENHLLDMKGVYVNELVEDGGAKEAGIKAGDVIVGINGAEVNSGSQLLEQLSRYRPGDKITVDVNRKGTKKEFTVTLKNRHGDTSIIQNGSADLILGAEFEKADQKLLQQLGLSHGVQVTDAGDGKFSEIGISDGFVITKINDRQINEVDDISAAMERVRGGLFISGVYPNGKKAYYAINLED
ncbi:trypsin-like peptidase domain-containing protein [Saccharicrinis sp. FJH62]|uniref:trypsin-like peptidase domain-containing protein n=1 Tax=Saccharicrinis sp. FJH62 TaxID=3344657 RepID=UPI0035D4A3A2